METPTAPTVPTDAIPDAVRDAIDRSPPRRIAILSFKVSGRDVPKALVYQLQDGFALGLVRNGVQVIDSEELRRRLAQRPELIGCDSSPCLKDIGRSLKVRHALRVSVDVTGNSYKMAARIFRTVGSVPAALPIDTQSRFCDICTVTEAREAMLRLADAITVPEDPLDKALSDSQKTEDLQPAANARRSRLVAGAGAAAFVAGIIAIAASDGEGRTFPALGGFLMGAGAAGGAWGAYKAGLLSPKASNDETPVEEEPNAQASSQDTSSQDNLSQGNSAAQIP